MSVNISIDPGLSATGWALWVNGDCIKTGTLRPPKALKEETDRLLWLGDELEKVLSSASDEFGQILTVAVEKFQGFTHKPNMLAMMKCSAARGVCLDVGRSYSKQVISVNKKTAGKSDAAWLAKAYKIKGSEHARDAVHLGCVAGFDRSRT